MNINKNEAATKINLEYVDIIDPQENEMLNDQEFLQQFKLDVKSNNDLDN